MTKVWNDLLNEAQTGDTRHRQDVLPHLQEHVERISLDRNQASELLGTIEVLLKDNNFKVAQGALQVLNTALIQNTSAVAQHVNFFLTPVVERMGDSKQQVREEATNVLLTLFEAIPVGALLLRLTWVWGNKNFRIKEELANTLANVFQNLGVGVLSAEDEQHLIGHTVNLLEDSVPTVREAALGLLAEFYAQTGSHMTELLRQYDIKGPQQREIEECFSGIDPVQDGLQRFTQPDVMLATASGKPEKRAPSPTAAKAPAGKTKRGGYGDAGGLTANGELPDAEPINLRSDSELKTKMAGIAKELDLKNDWEARCKALLQLEGIVLGGGTRFPSFVDELRTLKDGLLDQLNDRRSAVSRMACHLFGQIAVSIRNKFEPMAIMLFPHILKVSAISVQVMADSASETMETILMNCRVKGSVSFILNTVISDKNKIHRVQCSKLAVLILEVWERKTYERHLDLMESAIVSAIQDAQVDVRTYGRLAYGAFACSCPDRVAGLLTKQSPTLRDKLLQAGADYVRQNKEEPQTHSAAFGSLHQPAPTGGSRRVSEAGATMRGAASSRSTVAGGALRINHAMEEPYEEPPMPDRRKSFAQGPARVPNQQSQPLSLAPGHRIGSHETGAKRVPSAQDSHRSHYRDGDDDSNSMNGSYISNVSMSMSLAALVNRLKAAKASSDWEKKRDSLQDVRDWLIEQSSPAAEVDLVRLLDKLQPLIMEGMKDSHHQVNVAALEAWGEMSRHATKAQESFLDRVLSTAFLRAVDNKGVVRNAALTAITSASRVVPADPFLSALQKCLNNAKAAKSKKAVLDFFIQSLGITVASWQPSPGHPAVSAWLESIGKLLADRDPAVRRSAAEAMEHYYKNVNSYPVLAYITASDSSQQSAAKRALAKGVPDLNSQLAAFRRGDGFSLIGAHAMTGVDRARLISQAGKRSAENSPVGKAMPPGPVEPLQPEVKDQSPPLPVAPTLVEMVKDDGYQTHEEGIVSNRNQNRPPSARRHSSAYTIGGAAQTPGHPKTGLVTPPAHMPAAGAYLSSMYTSTPCSTPGSELRPLDTRSAVARLSALVSRLTVENGYPSIDTLVEIQKVSHCSHESAWKDHFAQVLHGLFCVLQKETADDIIYEHTLAALREMAHRQTNLFVPHLETSISNLLLCARRSRQVWVLADECLDELVTQLDPLRCVEILSLRLPSQEATRTGTSVDVPILPRAIANLGRAVSCLTAQELSHCLPKVLPGLFKGFDHQSSTVRMAVVNCLVGLYTVMGDQLMPHLVPLKADQLRIATMYMKKVGQGEPKMGLDHNAQGTTTPEQHQVKVHVVGY